MSKHSRNTFNKKITINQETNTEPKTVNDANLGRGMTPCIQVIDGLAYTNASITETPPTDQSETTPPVDDIPKEGVNSNQDDIIPDEPQDELTSSHDKAVSDWELADLESYIKGDAGDVSFNKLTDVINEHRRRVTSLDRAWNPLQCKEFLEQGIVPDKTTKGAWKEDATRHVRKACEWTTQELESWALGEITANGIANEGSLAHELKERLLIKSASNATEDIIRAYKYQTGYTTVNPHVGEIPTAPTPSVDVKAIEKTISYEGLTHMNQAYIEETLKYYVDAVKPGKPITYENGVKVQKQLDNVIRYIVNLPDPIGFKNGMNILKDFITKHRPAGNVFDDTHAFRFTDGLNPAGNIQESHIQFLTLFFIYVDKEKEARAQYDINALIGYFPTAKQPLLQQYFSELG